MNIATFKTKEATITLRRNATDYSVTIERKAPLWNPNKHTDHFTSLDEACTWLADRVNHYTFVAAGHRPKYVAGEA